MRLFFSSLLVIGSLLFSGSLPLRAADSNPSPSGGDSFYAMTLHGFFPGETRDKQPKTLNLYLVRRNGTWVAGIGTPTHQGRPVWNTALFPLDASALTVNGNRITGTVQVTLVPDPWVPADGKVRTATVTLDATATPSDTDPKTGSLGGTWTLTTPGTAEELEAARLFGKAEGKLTGGTGPAGPADLSDVSYDLTVYHLAPGKAFQAFQSRRAVSIGVREGKAVSTRTGMVDIRGRAYDYEAAEPPTTSRITDDEFTATTRFPMNTLDGGSAMLDITFQGRRVANWIAGTWRAQVRIDDQPPVTREGFFRGDVRKGAVLADVVKDDRPWFKPVSNFRPFKPGEHPRLFFRKEDVPELRRRAATPEGQAIVKRLRELLNGGDGESMPKDFNPAKKAYDERYKAPTGAYTISHAAGFGFLYQLTGDTRYADLARQCVELAWKGQRSADDRYSWVAAGGELRAGPSLGWYAAAYDLCYDAWPEDFRIKMAQAIQNYHDDTGGEWAKPTLISLEKMVLQPNQGPGSNHFGAVVGGCGLAVLAILDDPGTDTALLRKYLTVLERQVVRHLSAGWGDGGYYHEGWGASRVGTQGGFLPFLQALRVAVGRDYVNVERPNATYITMVPRCLLVVGPPAVFPYRSNMGPTYGKPEIGAADQRTGFSHGGYFSEGFGAVADRHKPGLLWTYRHLFDPQGTDPFDLAGPYPHRAMLALVNWPLFYGVAEADPARELPLAIRDTLYDHVAFRNRFRDQDDVIVTALFKQPSGTKPREIMVWGFGGLRLSMGEPPRTPITHYASAPDGSGLVTAGSFGLAVDFSGASGADVLVVTVGGPEPAAAPHNPKVRQTKVQAGETIYHVLSLSTAAKHPEPVAQGETLVVGGQKITWKNGRIEAEKFGSTR